VAYWWPIIAEQKVAFRQWMLLFFHQKSWSPYPKTKTPANYSLAKVAPALHDLIEGQGGLAFESEGYVLFELRVNASSRQEDRRRRQSIRRPATLTKD